MRRALWATGFLASALIAPPAIAAETVYAERHLDMEVLPEDARPAWERVGDGHAFLLEDGTLVLNDNSSADRIAYQTLVGEIVAEHRVRLSGSVRVISNIEGEAVTMEVARPGLEIVLRLFPDRLVLVERESDGSHRWLGASDADFGVFRRVDLVKTSARGGADETIVVSLDGTELLNVTAVGLGGLGVGRVAVGSFSYPDVGASIWDWLELRITLPESVPTLPASFGALKSRYGDGR